VSKAEKLSRVLQHRNVQ